MSDEKKSNVIPFPRLIHVDEDGDEVPHAAAPPQTMEEVQTRIESIRQIHVQECSQVIAVQLFKQFMVSGFNVMDDSYKKDIALVIESVRSLMLKTYDIYHPFQDMAEAALIEKQEDVLSMAESLNIEFKLD